MFRMIPQILLMMFAFAGAKAHAAGLDSVYYSCQTHSRGSNMNSLTVDVAGVQNGARTVAEITRSSMGRPNTVIARLPVVARNQSMTREFLARGFKLVINLESFAPTTEHIGQLTADLGGQRYNETVVCQAIRPVAGPRPDQVTCMAYWTGFVINEHGQCVSRGASGCSNPFEFTTLNACEAARRRN